MPINLEPYLIQQGERGACDVCGSPNFVRRPSPDPAAPLFACRSCGTVFVAREPIVVAEPNRRWLTKRHLASEASSW